MSKNDWLVYRVDHGGVDRRFFPPEVVVEVKRIACELPEQLGIPLSRFSISELQKETIKRGITAEISGSTIWRWLAEDAIKPWSYRSWIFPRDPEFSQKASRVLDLYNGYWSGKRLTERDYVIFADEKTSIQARRRRHDTMTTPGQAMRVEAEYQRKGALVYFAAWDVGQGKIFGRCEPKNAIVAFSRLVDLVMKQQPYRSARRVFWVLDNSSVHRGKQSVIRLQKQWPNIMPVHLPVHASWLNQIEIYFSIIQRKVLSPNNFESVSDLKRTLLAFQERYQKAAKPFQWKFTKRDLRNLLSKLSAKDKAA